MFILKVQSAKPLIFTGAVKDVEKQLARYNQFEKIPQPETFLDMVGVHAPIWLAEFCVRLSLTSASYFHRTTF